MEEYYLMDDRKHRGAALLQEVDDHQWKHVGRQSTHFLLVNLDQLQTEITLGTASHLGIESCQDMNLPWPSTWTPDRGQVREGPAGSRQRWAVLCGSLSDCWCWHDTSPLTPCPQSTHKVLWLWSCSALLYTALQPTNHITELVQEQGCHWAS